MKVWPHMNQTSILNIYLPNTDKILTFNHVTNFRETSYYLRFAEDGNEQCFNIANIAGWGFY